MPVTTSGESSHFWKLVKAYRQFATLLVLEVALLGASLSYGVSEEDSALLPLLPLPSCCLDTLASHKSSGNT